MGTDRQVLGNRVSGQHGADREATAQALGTGKDVRGHAVMLVGIQMAATAHAGLHFVEDQQGVVLVAQFAGAFQIGLLGRQHAALALHRFQNDGAGLVRDGCFQRIQIVVRNVRDTGNLRAEAVGILGLTTDVHGKQGTAMEAVQRRDDFVLVFTELFAGITTRQFQCRFVGLGAGVAEEHAVGKGGVHQLVRQTQSRLIGEHVGDVPELARLLGERLDQCRMGMTEGVDGDAAGKVDQLAARLVPDTGAFAANRNEGGRGVVGNHYLIEIGALHMRSGHRGLLPRAAIDERIVGTDWQPALPPCDNFLQRQHGASRGLQKSDRKRREGAV